MNIQNDTPSSYSELLDQSGNIRVEYQNIYDFLDNQDIDSLRNKINQNNSLVVDDSISFRQKPIEDKQFLVDLIPRLIPGNIFDKINKGLTQRAIALNLFLNELYTNGQTIVPDEIIKSSSFYYPECVGCNPPQNIYMHVYSPDLVRTADDNWQIVEDNVRIPSGISHALRQREIMNELYTGVIETMNVANIDTYPEILKTNLETVSGIDDAVIVLLSEGQFNSAFYDHKYLAEKMNIPLVEPRDLYIDDDDYVQLRTIDGDVRVHLIYRHVQDLDLFVPGLSRSYITGKINLANAWGTGVVDDIATLPFVEKMIKQYLDQDALLKSAPTYSLHDTTTLKHVTANLEKMVVKSRGRNILDGVMIGPETAKNELQEWKEKVLSDPLNYVVQDCLESSMHGAAKFEDKSLIIDSGYIDLRAYVLTGENIDVMNGGISRLAANGTRKIGVSEKNVFKDTWVVE